MKAFAKGLSVAERVKLPGGRRASVQRYGYGPAASYFRGGALGWCAVLSSDSLPPLPRPQSASITITQPGLLPYSLGCAQREQAQHGTFPLLTVSGTLPGGHLLRLRLLTGQTGTKPAFIT